MRPAALAIFFCAAFNLVALAPLQAAEPHDPNSLVYIAAEDARARLVARGYDVADLDISGITILELPGRMPCAGNAALGCFAVRDIPMGAATRAYGVMAYARVSPTKGYPHGDVYKVLVHEWTHALLWLAGDPTWGVHDERFKR
jgi:hypothetical protein